MAFIALVSAGDTTPGTLPPGFQAVGGITLLERQVRQILKAGAARVLVVAPALPEEVEARFARDERIVSMPNAAGLVAHLIDSTQPVLVLAPGILLDERLIDHMVQATHAPMLMVFRDNAAKGAERLDAHDHWAGIARLPANMVAHTVGSLGDWDLTSTLVRKAVEADAKRTEVGALDTYAASRRREVPFVWARPQDEPERQAATDLLIAAAQKGCLDWPARFIHAPIENFAVRLLLDTPVTPNLITVFTIVLGFLAIGAFAAGWLWVGLALILIVGPLDGVDGKLARTRSEFSRWGDLEHVADKIVEYGSFIAMGYWFSTNGHGLAAWLAAGGIIIFCLSEALKGEFFRRFTGKQLDDWGPFERHFRLVGGRRNTFFWSLIPFGATGLWFEGFLMILAYAAVTFGVAEWRLMMALFDYARETDDRVEKNFTATSYDFLPKARVGSR